MEKVIEKTLNGVKYCTYYLDKNNKYFGVFIRYWSDGSIMWRTNYANGKKNGLETQFFYKNKVEKQTYYL